MAKISSISYRRPGFGRNERTGQQFIDTYSFDLGSTPLDHAEDDRNGSETVKVQLSKAFPHQAQRWSTKNVVADVLPYLSITYSYVDWHLRFGIGGYADWKKRSLF